MKINNIKFLTPSKIINNSKIILEKEYSQKLQLSNDATLTIASHSGIENIPQQDAVAVSLNGGYTILMVADGMGGTNYGEIASYYTVDTIKKLFELEDPEYLQNITKEYFEEILYAIVYEIQTLIKDYSGTTLSIALIGPDKTIIANIGDSRIYTVKDDKINLQTQDDSMAFKTFKPQTAKEREHLRFYRQNNLITNCISKSMIPEIKTKTIDNKDYQSLCLLTDGITDILTEQEVKEYLSKENPAKTLVENATYGDYIFNNNDDWNVDYAYFVKRGQDNATAVVYTKKLTK